MAKYKTEFVPLKAEKIDPQQSLLANSSKFESQNARKSYLMNSNQMSYILQTLPEILQNNLIQEIIENNDEVDESKLNLQRSPTFSKIYPSKQGRLKVEVDSWLCCIFNRGRNTQFRNCSLNNNVLQVGDLGASDLYYICFNVLSVNITRINPMTFKISVRGKEQIVYLFEGETASEAEQWFKMLSGVIKESDGNTFDLKSITDQPNFQKYQYVSEKDFVDRCGCGDIILFKNDSSFTMAKLQRWATFSDFDHVGIILKNIKNEVFIFESTTSAGVSIMEWKHFMKYRFYDYTQKIAWRKLSLKLTNNDISAIEDFIYANINKQYHISIQRLMIMKSVIPGELNQDKPQKKGYFCSQLVAALYKKLGLIQLEKSTSQYYPSTFSKPLPLLRGELGPVITIVFEEELISHNRK